MWTSEISQHILTLLRRLAPKRNTRVGALLLVALGAGLLAGCGATTAGQAQRTTAQPSPTTQASPTAPVMTPATATPTAAPTPPSQPPAHAPAPAILDVRPSSMSIVGHLDCGASGAFTCAAVVLSRSSNQSTLHWTTSTSVPGHVTFSPASGSLAPGQSIRITITVPLTDCARGLFAFHGSVNTHTISWAC